MPHYPRMYAVAAAILGDATGDAADAVQVALVRIWKSGKKMAEIANPEGYAVATVRTVAIDMIRTRRYTDDIEEASGISSVPSSDPDTAEFLNWIIGQLPEGQREVMRLSAFGCLGNDEIARSTGQSVENVRQLLCRGRKKVKELYKKYMQP